MDDVLDLAELRDAVSGALRDRELTIPGDEGRTLDRALWADMAALGWLSLGVATEHGGLGQRFAQAAVLHEELGRITASVPSLATLLAANVIGAHGSTELQARILPGIVAGELTVGVALSPSASVDAAGRVDGAFEHVLYAADVDYLLLPVTDGFALLAAGGDGVSVENVPAVDLTRRLGRVALRQAPVASDALIPLNAEARVLVANEAAIAVASDCIGGAHAIFERTIDYLGVREQFDRPIGSFQALKHRAAHWKVQLEAATALVRHAANALDAEPNAAALAASAKFYACDLYVAICEDAIQMHGGIGFTWEHPCHLFLKRAKLNQQLFGGSAKYKDRVAELEFTQADRAAGSQ